MEQDRDYARTSRALDSEMRILRLVLTAVLLVSAWTDVLLGTLILTSEAVGTIHAPGLALHFAHIPPAVWATAILCAGGLQLLYRTRVIGLTLAAVWHVCFAFPFVYIAVGGLDTGPHFAVGIYLGLGFSRAVKAAALAVLRRDRKQACRG